MEHIERSIEVDAPISAVYNQWTQFEEFPRFMDGVEEVRQVDEKRLLWRVKFWGKETEWDAEIYEQIPDRRIAWQSISGHPNTGVVSFETSSPGRTLVTLVIDYEPLGTVERLADFLGLVSEKVQRDLEKFRDYIEGHGVTTGGWRGEIH